MCTARTGVPGADIQRTGTERRRNRQFFSIAQLIVGDRGQQGIHAGIRAIGHLLDVYQRMVNKLSEERVTGAVTANSAFLESEKTSVSSRRFPRVFHENQCFQHVRITWCAGRYARNPGVVLGRLAPWLARFQGLDRAA